MVYARLCDNIKYYFWNVDTWCYIHVHFERPILYYCCKISGWYKGLII